MAPGPFASLLTTGKYSDFVIECEGRTFKVHKSIVCPQSPVLERALGGHFEEARTNAVKVEEFGAAVVQRMLSFMHGEENPLYSELPAEDGEDVQDRQPRARVSTVVADENTNAAAEAAADECDKKPAVDANPLLRHIWTNAIANYYGVTALAELARKEIDTIFARTSVTADEFVEASGVLAEASDDTIFAEMGVTADEFVEASGVLAEASNDAALHRMFVDKAIQLVLPLSRTTQSLDGVASLDNFVPRLIRSYADFKRTARAEFLEKINTANATIATMKAEAIAQQKQLEYARSNEAVLQENLCETGTRWKDHDKISRKTIEEQWNTIAKQQAEMLQLKSEVERLNGEIPYWQRSGHRGW